MLLHAFTQCVLWQQPHAKHAQDHDSDAALCQITVQRMSVPYAGFVETVREFEDWTELLLLDALQRSGFFLAGSQAITLAELQARVPAGYKRFIAEATDLLKASGDTGTHGRNPAKERPFLIDITSMYTFEFQSNRYGQRRAFPFDVDGYGAGHLESLSDGRLALSAQARTAECVAALQTLQSTGKRLAQGPGAGIATNIKLVSVCMEALPKILAGVLKFCCVCSAVANASGAPFSLPTAAMEGLARKIQSVLLHSYHSIALQPFSCYDMC